MAGSTTIEELVGYALGPQQMRLWNERHDRALGVQAVLLINGPIEHRRLQEAVDTVAARHEILRTTFSLLPGMETPLQVIDMASSITISELEATESELKALIEEAQAVRWSNEKPFRVTLVRVGNEKQALILSLSPLCGDAWSMKNLIAELAAHLAGRQLKVKTEELVQYAQFTEWQRELLGSNREEDEKAREYWRRQVENLPEPIVLPGEQKARDESQGTSSVGVKLDGELLARTRAVAASKRASVARVLLAAWQVLLYRISGAEQLLIEYGTAARKYKEMESGLGQYMTWLPVKAQLTAKQTFEEVLNKLAAVVDGHSKHQEHFNPHTLAAGERKKLGIGFSSEEWPPVHESGYLRLEVKSLSSSTAALKLHLQVWEHDEGTRLEFWYAREHYSEALVQRLAAQYVKLLTGAVSAVESRLEDLSMLGAEERELVSRLGFGRRRSVPAATLHELFEQQVERSAAAPAVCYKEESLSYQELNRRANKLAHYLIASGCQREDRLAILLERGVEMIAAVLAVLKAGCAYVPLEPNNPAPRLLGMLEDATPKVVLTQSSLQSRVQGWPSIAVDAISSELDSHDFSNPRVQSGPSNLAYVLYTSGTKGRPKGVAVEHASVVNLLQGLEAAIYEKLPGCRRVAMNAPLSFDASVKQLFQTVQGRSLYLVPEELRVSGPEMLGWCEAAEIDVLDITPSHLRLILEAGLLTAQRPPRAVLVGGEAIEEEMWERLHGQSAIRFYNVYGPTECTVDTTVMSIEASPQPSLGNAIDNVSAYVLDQTDELVGIGETGELCVAGAGVGRGYFNEPEMTATKFVPHARAETAGARLYRTGDLARWLADGRLEYLGRRDGQVKVRGSRIQLGEIEAALMKHAGVRECLVLADEEREGDTQLTAYVIPEQRDSGVKHGGGEQYYGLPNGLTICHHNRNETEYLYHEIYENRCYTRHGISLKEDACVLDVGANIGLFTLFAAERCRHGKIYAFEPLTPLCATLRLNSRLSQVPVQVFPYGLGAEEEITTFSYYPGYTMMSGRSEYADEAADVSVIERYLENEVAVGVEGAKELLDQSRQLLAGRFAVEEQECRLRRLSEVLKEEGIECVDLLKIDVQRAEQKVLQGVAVDDWKKIRQVVLEAHDEKEGHGPLAEIVEMLEGQGFEVVTEQDRLLRGTDRWNVYARRVETNGAARGKSKPGIRSRGRSAGGGRQERVELNSRELRRHLERLLPEHMIPASFVKVEAIPFLPSGKVDRRALAKCKAISITESRRVTYETPVEEMVAAIWMGLLKRESVTREDNFFEQGGHSLLATQVISRVREVFGVEVGLRWLFEEPTVRGFSAKVAAELNIGAMIKAPAVRRLDAAERAAWRGLLPLSYAQQRLWFLNQLEPESEFYNCSRAVRLEGDLCVESLQRTLSEIVRRHEVLRMRFVAVDGEPRQEVLIAEPFELPVVDLSELGAAEREAVVRETIASECRQPFALDRGPLMRVKLLRLGAAEHVVVLLMHHIVSDAWSMGLLLKEVGTLYAAYSRGLETPLPELAVQYSDYAVCQRQWLQGAMLERQLSYWREQLRDLPVLELPADRMRPAVQSYEGEYVRFRLTAATSAQLKELSRREGVTLFMTLLAAFQALLAWYSGQRDIVVGTPIAGRTHQQIEPLIGFFVNTLVLRSSVNSNESFRELLGQVREVCLGAYAHQEVPFEKLVEELQQQRNLSRSPLFQAMFAMQQAPEEELSLPGLKLSGMSASGAIAKFDISADFSEDRQGQLTCTLTYATSLFAQATIERMGRYLQRLLEAVAESPDARLGEVSLLTAADEEQLRSWAVTEVAAVTRKSVAELFAEQAARSPEAIAVISGTRQLSYGELNRRANQMAHYLRRRGVGVEQRVGLCTGRSEELLIGLLGIMKAGGAYVPLDPSYPHERLKHMMAQAGVKLLLTEPRLTGAFADTGVEIVHAGAAELERERGDNPGAQIDGANLAYVIYTSGSTGLPKGVMIEHAALTNFSNVIAAVYDITANDRVLQFASLSFDASAEEIYPTLLRGACLVLRNDEMLSTTEEFLRQCAEQGITVLDLPTAYWHELVATGGAKQIPESLRLVVIGGEKARRERVRQWHEEVKRPVRLVNGYGPTEATVVATASELVKTETLEVKIGRPLSNVEVYVLDQQLRLVPVGIAGELYLGGAGLARGYEGRAEETAERFVPHPYSASGGARLYRTGDMVRYLESGELEYIGRRDEQVKVRGYRIELGEIETVLEAHARVRQAAALVRAERLVVYVVGERGWSSEREMVAELRPYLRERLPEYMTPQRWVLLEHLPLTRSGKIDRQRLPEPAQDGELPWEDEATATEEIVAGIWSEVLRRDGFGRDENFFALGGHSLLATQVISRLRQVFGVEVGLRRLFEEPTVRGLSRIIEQLLRGGEELAAPPLQRIGVEERRQWGENRMPLSFAQQRLWFLGQLEPGNTSYNMPLPVRLKGELRVEVLERTLSEIVRRHEVLRTRFVNVDGEPRQEVLTAEPVTLVTADLSHLDDQQREAAVDAAVAAESNEPFDLGHGPLLRAKLLRLSAEEHVMLLTMHHIVGDGWSLGVLTTEVATLYAAYRQDEESPLAEVAVQYSDFALWQRGWLQGEELERQLSYWRGQLSGELPVLELQPDRPRPAIQSHRGALLGFRLSAAVSLGLKKLSRREGATLFMTLLAAFQTLLHRYSGQHDIVVGSPIAGRNYKETEGLIGFFVNTLAMRTDLSGEPTFVELLGRVKEVCIGAYAHQDVPFEKLVEELQPERDLSRSPVFQAMFILQNVPQEQAFHLPGLKLSGVSGNHATAKFDLTLAMQQRGDGLHGSIEYCTDLFHEARIARLVRHFEALLRGIVAEPERRLWELPLLDADELETISGWNETRRDFPATPVPQLFQAQAERTPGAIAVVCGAEHLSYSELSRRANKLAHHLLKLGVGPDALVGLCIERSVELVVGVLGILKAGAAYVPLDPGYPAARLNFMVKDAGIRVLLGAADTVAKVAEHSVHVLRLDEQAATIDDESDLNPAVAPAAGDLAYVIYTSGSTGTPKGVMVTHGALTNFLNSMLEKPGLTEKDVLLAVTTFSFDIAALELFLPLIVGGKVLMVGRQVATDGIELNRQLAASGATVMQATPSTWRMLVEAGWQGNNQLKALCGGEALTPELAEALRHRSAEWWQMYGPTETTIWSVCGELELVNGAAPLGRAISNTQIYIVDDHLQQLPVGVAGELLIGGDGLARGYYNRPELTAEKFIPDCFSGIQGSRLYVTGDRARYLADGQIQFLGRSDQQVKVRGHRIELGEIEAVLETHETVRQAVAVVNPNKQLVAYVVGMPDAEAELRFYLRERLPEYMMPAHVVMLDALPLTPNGKIDRKALTAASIEHGTFRKGEYVAPSNEIEELLAIEWCRLLGVERISVHDNFFDLGGHSMLATRAIFRLNDLLGIEVSLRHLLEAPTISELASRIQALLRPQSESGRWSPLVKIQSGAAERILFGIHDVQGSVTHYVQIARSIGPEQTVYALQARGSDTDDPPETSLSSMAACYIDAIREIQPDGPYSLAGYSFGGHVAFEMAQQLRAQGEDVAQLILLNTHRSITPEMPNGDFDDAVYWAWWFAAAFKLPQQQRKSLFKQLRRLSFDQRVEDIVGRLKLSGLEKYDIPATRLCQKLRVQVSNARALFSYEPEKYPFRITFVVAEESRDAELGWQELVTGGLDIHQVPGTHESIINNPHVSRVGDVMRKCLAKA